MWAVGPKKHFLDPDRNVKRGHAKADHDGSSEQVILSFSLKHVVNQKQHDVGHDQDECSSQPMDPSGTLDEFDDFVFFRYSICQIGHEGNTENHSRQGDQDGPITANVQLSKKIAKRNHNANAHHNP